MNFSYYLRDCFVELQHALTREVQDLVPEFHDGISRGICVRCTDPKCEFKFCETVAGERYKTRKVFFLLISEADISAISGPISVLFFLISSSSDELADAGERTGLNGSVFEISGAAVAIFDFVTFGKTAPVQPKLIRFGIFEDYVKVDCLSSISLFLKSPYDFWSARSQRLKKGPISEFLASNTQYFFLCNCFSKFECIFGISAPKTYTTRNFIAKLQYEVLHFPCKNEAESLSCMPKR